MTDSLQVGGTERQFVALARELDQDRFQLRLGCLQRKGPFLQGVGDIQEFGLGGSFFSLQAQRARWILARHLRTEKIAVAHAFDFYSNLMLIPTARMAGVPVVIGSHRQLGDLLTPMQFRAQAMMFRLCDRVVCNSRAAGDRLIRHGFPENKLAFIVNGLPQTAFAETLPALPPHEGLVRVGLIARMNDPVKNHAGFLRMVGRLANKIPQTEFLLVGDGPLRSGLESLAQELGVRHRVNFLGERQDIPGLLASMDISVVFSFSESQSNVALESMARGVPVVATRVGGNPEVVREGETGLLVAPGDEEQLATAVERLIAQPTLRAELGQAAKKFVQSNFSMDRVVKQYEEMYEGLLAAKVSRRPRSHRWVGANVDSHRVRVAIVAASPRWIGGQSVQASALCRNWENDPSVDARFIPVDPELPLSMRWVERIPFLRTVVRMPFFFVALWKGIRDEDIVHIFSASYWSFLVASAPAWIVARARRKKTLMHYHSGEARDHLRGSSFAIHVLRNTDRLVVPSGYLVGVFREFRLEAEAVPNIVDSTRFAFRPRRPLRPRLLNTRGLHPYYGIDVVVRAFAKVQREFSEATLCLVGRGPLEKEIRALVQDIAASGIEFAGGMGQEEIARILRQNDIFVNGSRLDNAPVSILEAFASGTPVVSTAANGIDYMVEHGRTGLLCAPEDWRGLAENVLRLLRDPDLAECLARNAHEEVRRYGWEVVRTRWLEVYRSLLGRSSREEVLSDQDSLLYVSAQRSNPTRKELPDEEAVLDS
jgi:L-malate glycosyltransferase